MGGTSSAHKPHGDHQRCYSLTNWLIEIRTAAGEVGLSSDWQRTVDALVVAGYTYIAPYSDTPSS